MSSATVARAQAAAGVEPEHVKESNAIRVLAWPGPRARSQNPYTWLLCSHLTKLGAEVREFTPVRALRGGYDVLHLHWPDKALNAVSWIGSAARAAVALAIVEAAHLHGARVVWTAHNAEPHESKHPRLERWFWRRFVRSVDAVIHPSKAGQLAVEARYPHLVARPHAVVAHGHFRAAYPDDVTRDDARAALGISAGARVIAYIGRVRHYKNVPHLVRTARRLFGTIGDLILLVGGAPQTEMLAREIRDAAGGDARIRLRLEHIPEADVQHYLRAADLIVLPFTEITNSGSAVLSLSFDRPVLVPALGAMGELQAQVGRDWVRTYEGELTPDELAKSIDWAARRQHDARPDLDELEWPLIARQTLALYLASAS